MFFVIIFALITTSGLLSMEKSEPSTISITTVDKYKTYIATEIASKIPLINHLIENKIYDIEFKQYVTSSALSFALKSIDCTPQIHKIYKTEELAIMPKTFQETIALYKTLDYLRFDKEVTLTVLRHACFGCPLTESDLEEAKKISINSIAIEAINPYYDYTSEPSCSVLETKKYGDNTIFSPDGKALASASNDDKTIKLWDSSTGDLIRTLEGHPNGYIHEIAFSSNGKALASASADNTIKLWNSSTGELIETFVGHINAVKSIAFSPNGKALASASADNTIKLWDSSTGELIRTFKGHINTIKSIAFSPNGKTLASASGDKTIKLWDPSTGKLIGTLKGHTDWVICITFSPDGKTLASASWDKTIKLWSSSTGKLIEDLKRHTGYLSKVIFSPDGKILASASYDKTIKLWSSSTGELITTLDGHPDWIKHIAFSPSGSMLVGNNSTHSFSYCLKKLNLSFQELLRKRYEESQTKSLVSLKK